MYGVILSRSDFVTTSWNPDQTLYATRWQIRRVGDGWWASETIDSDWDTTNADPYYTGAVLDETVDYEARIALMDQFYEQSDWSDPVSIPALFTEGDPPPIHGSAGSARQQNLFFGTTDALLLADSGVVDRTVAYALLLRPSEIVPAGIGGDNIFGPLYITAASLIGTTLKITPICDGRRLPEIELVLEIDPLFRRRTYEIDLREAYDVDAAEVASLGVRGGSFTAEIKIDAMVHERFEIHGVEVEVETVQETLPDVTYTPEMLVDVDLDLPQILFFGGGGDMMRADDGVDDNGENIVALIGTDELLPEGEGGEATFRTLYLAVTRNNAADLTLELVPVLEGTELDPIDIVLAGVDGTVGEIIEIDLTVPYMVDDVEVARFDARGNAIAFILRSSGALPAGTVIIEHSELEYFTEQETLEPANG